MKGDRSERRAAILSRLLKNSTWDGSFHDAPSRLRENHIVDASLDYLRVEKKVLEGNRSDLRIF